MNRYNINTTDLLSKHNGDKNSAAEELVDLVVDGTIWFPFQRYFRKSAQDLMQGVREADLTIKKKNRYRLYSYYPESKLYLPPQYKGDGIIIYTDNSTYLNADVISDIFIEDVRLKAKRYDQTMSILEHWIHKESMVKLMGAALDNDFITPEVMRSVIYKQVAETKIFRPTWAKSLLDVVIGLENIAGKKWLDISAGWGDRLIAAMALDMDYLGFDPNEDLMIGHNQMINMFGSQDRHQVVYEPFETTEAIGDRMFDVVLSSPPYFDVEDYAPGQEGQSIVSYPDYDIWMKQFMFVSLSKAWNHLKVGGHLILHLGDTRTTKLCEPTNLFIEEYLEGASWEGIIGLEGLNEYPRPTWIWKKVDGEVNRWNRNVERSLSSCYPQLA